MDKYTQHKIREWDASFEKWRLCGFKKGENEDPKRPEPGEHPVPFHWWNTNREEGFKAYTSCDYNGGEVPIDEY